MLEGQLTVVRGRNSVSLLVDGFSYKSTTTGALHWKEEYFGESG